MSRRRVCSAEIINSADVKRKINRVFTRWRGQQKNAVLCIGELPFGGGSDDTVKGEFVSVDKSVGIITPPVDFNLRVKPFTIHSDDGVHHQKSFRFAVAIQLTIECGFTGSNHVSHQKQEEKPVRHFESVNAIKVADLLQRNIQL